MSKKLLFVYNPHSGKAQIKLNLCDIIDTFTKASYIVTAMPTQKANDAYFITKEMSSDYDILVISGGDGTLNEAVRGLMQLPKTKRVPLGYIPAGSTNDYASSLEISKDMLIATKSIINGTPCSCDVGKFEDTHFVYVSAFGAFTDVAYDTPQKTKNLLGHTAYVLEGLKRLNKIKSIHMKFKNDINGKIEVVEGDYLLGFICNTRSIGGLKGKGNLSTKLDDGLLEVLLINAPKNPLDFQLILSDVLKQDVSSKNFTIFKTSKLEITADEDVKWTLDGENGGAFKSLVISAEKKAYDIIIDRDKTDLFESI